MKCFFFLVVTIFYLFYLFIVQTTRFTFARLNELNLSGGEADQQRGTIANRNGFVEIMTTWIGAFVQFLIDWFAQIGRYLLCLCVGVWVEV